VLNISFVRKDTHEKFRIINAHLPGEPGNPAPEEFARYVAAVASSTELVIAMGDMNFNEVEMKTAFAKSVPQGVKCDMLAPYCTNIGLDFCSKAIDHFFFLGKTQHTVSENTPEDVMPDLGSTLELLDQPDFSRLYTKNRSTGEMLTTLPVQIMAR
jgi:hypothetical protein